MRARLYFDPHGPNGVAVSVAFPSDEGMAEAEMRAQAIAKAFPTAADRDVRECAYWSVSVADALKRYAGCLVYGADSAAQRKMATAYGVPRSLPIRELRDHLHAAVSAKAAADVWAS